MTLPRTRVEHLRILQFWWTIELFSPQPVPKPTRRLTRPEDRQTIEWRAGELLPWEQLAPPKPVKGTPRQWRHTVYLGVYPLEATYEFLHRAFGEDTDAYDERPAGESACAGILVDPSGRVFADSAVLSSALWAVSRIINPGPQHPRWTNGFSEALEAFIEAVDRFESARRDRARAEQPLPVDADALAGLLAVAQSSAGIDGQPDLATDRIIIDSVAVSVRRDEDSVDIDFLNSLFLDDLQMVRARVADGDIGPALTAYLTGDDAIPIAGRRDVVTDPVTVDAGVVIQRLPKGRWPSSPEHSLALSQQFAVNQALVDLAPTTGLMGVNGPPGTGKTTMLRDVLAGNVVERARRLAALPSFGAAFTTVTHNWTAKEGHPRRVRQLIPELTGFEMVVASANNAAVENVTTEIPAQSAISTPWRGSADYFGAIATEVLLATETGGTGDSEETPTAWGLVAARLGNKRNRSTFRSAFWFDPLDPKTKDPASDGTPRMQTRLQQWKNGGVAHPTWTKACQSFRLAEARVDELITERRRAQDRLQQVRSLVERERTATTRGGDTRGYLTNAERDLAEQTAIQTRAESERAQATVRHDRHFEAKPGILESIFTFGRAVKDWRLVLQQLQAELRAAQELQREAASLSAQTRQAIQRAQADLAVTEQERQRLQRELGELRAALVRDETRYGASYPGVKWTGDVRELHAPWLEAELDTARTELFLAALQLHQDFLALAAHDMLDGLRAAMEVVAGEAPPTLEEGKRRAAWQLFFLVVPLVSTTFASVGRMFSGVGGKAIGWLLIDEAGQASPQYAAGAIWRARRVVAVGDPLQLQPVVTIPPKAQRDIASYFDVSASWIPPRASVQTLADRVAIFGTHLQQGEDPVWVSAPLRVHRRCDNPMFDICNAIAYHGIMVNGVQRKRPDLFTGSDGTPLIAKSHWVDEPADTPGTHLQPQQIARLRAALAYLRGHGVKESDVIAISPFRAVADRLDALTTDYPDLRAGTIHTAQGREAPVVILVLGGDPGSPGAKAWAASSPNLVNVAVSRAQRRLYVIGDRSAWEQHPYFRELAAALRE